MPTRPPSPDPSGTSAEHPALSGLGAGLNFFQDWLKAAGSALPNLAGSAGSGSAASAGMPAWSMPTLDPQELDKRIQDLKTVQFWLEQNARMIAMTIQGLEVQKMTLSTLQGMNVSMDALRDRLKARPPEAAPETPAEPEAAAPSAETPDLVNPMQWWDTLTQQFSHLATQANAAPAATRPQATAPARKAAAKRPPRTPKA